MAGLEILYLGLESQPRVGKEVLIGPRRTEKNKGHVILWGIHSAFLIISILKVRKLRLREVV